MKKKYLWIEFAIVLIFLIIPPLTVLRMNQAISNFTISPALFVELLIAVLLDIQMHFMNQTESRENTARSPIFIKLSWGAITFGCLILIFTLFEVLAYFFPTVIKSNVESVIPNSALQWISCVVILSIGAYYEESLYRQFIPDMACLLLESKVTKPRTGKYVRAGIEISTVLLFAFAHRYLGVVGILNALLCGTILRLCTIKTGSIYTSTTIHFLYNICMFLLLLF